MVENIMKYPTHVTRLRNMQKKVYTPICDLSALVYATKEPVKLAELEERLFAPVKHGEKWAGTFDCAWFRFTGEVPASAAGKKVVALINVNGEGAVYDVNDNCNVKCGVTRVMYSADAVQPATGKQVVDLFDKAKGGESVDLMVDAGFNGLWKSIKNGAKFKYARLAVKDDAVNDYYYDYLTLFCLVLTYGKNPLLKKDRVVELLSALNGSYALYSKGEIARARELLRVEYTRDIDYKAPVYSAVGHAHLDLAWLWPLRETKRKAVRTYATAMRNVEKYPDYVFGSSQAQQFEWIKDENPVLFEKIKKAVKNGRLEIQGGMWTENDSNTPSGESLIRQFLYGDRFFMDNFGVRSKMVWLPDAFGFPACLPQIYRKCDKDFFYTIKLTWNEQNTFPYKYFRWKGIDGSEVLAHMSPEGTYNSSGSPLAIVKSEKKNPQSKEMDGAILCYGAGDGGGGPGEGSLEMLKREGTLKGLNQVVCRGAEQFYKDLAEQIDIIPEYDGELYLEKHQGTYTTQGRNKLYNRLLEDELRNVEWLGAIGLCCGIGYDKAAIAEIWKEVLLYQFHDILPGSSIERVYVESRARYAEMLAQVKLIRDKLIEDLSAGKEGLSVVNPVPFARREFMKIDGKWKVVTAEPYATAKLTEPTPDAELVCTEDSIENGLIKLKFDAKGVIVSMVDKTTGKELSKGGLNRLAVFREPPRHYDAWDLRIDYEKRRAAAPRLIASHQKVDEVKVVRHNTFKVGSSVIEQEITLKSGDKLVYFKTQVDWKEKHKMLRAEFRPTIWNDKVNCDIQFGSIDRSTKDETSIEKAQFEICAHKFVNVDEDDYGFAVLNKCKYGHRVKDGLISVNLLRSPTYPDKHADEGEHLIRYAIYAHEGKLCDSDLVRRAYNFNNPMFVENYALNLTEIADVSNPNIVLETVKCAEDGSGIVLRLYERFGRAEKGSLNINVPYKGVYSANMLEEIEGECDLQLEFTPFEIKTIFIKL